MNSEPILKEMNHNLEILIKLLAYQIVEKRTLSEGAPLLRRLGLNAAEIAAIYESTPQSISVRIAEAKKKKRSKPKRE